MGDRYRVAKDVVSEVLDGKAVVLHLGSGKYFALNGTATRMWELLCHHGERDAVLEAMRREYEIGDATLEADLNRLLKDLLDRGLLDRNT